MFILWSLSEQDVWYRNSTLLFNAVCYRTDINIVFSSCLLPHSPFGTMNPHSYSPRDPLRCSVFHENNDARLTSWSSFQICCWECAALRNSLRYTNYILILCRSQLPRDLTRRCAADRLLRLRFRNLPEAWMSVCCECCVLSGRGPCDKLITLP